MWGFMYLPSTSPFSYITRQLGLGSDPVPRSARHLRRLANIAIWGGVGFNMLVIYTALRSIPAELIEAARLDGAGELQIALRVKVPLVRPALVLTVDLRAARRAAALRRAATLKPLTNAISDTWAPLMTIYRDAFTLDNLPAAAAASMVLAIGTAVVSLAVLGAVRMIASGAPDERHRRPHRHPSARPSTDALPAARSPRTRGLTTSRARSCPRSCW